MVLALAVPPATITSAMPDMMVAAANCTGGARGAVSVDGYPRHAGHTEAHGDVACDHAATLQ